MQETDPLITDQMEALKERLGKHKKNKQVKASLGSMQCVVDSILQKAASIGARQDKPVDEKKRVDTIINTIRRGWTAGKDDEEEELGSQSSISNVLDSDIGPTQINGNSPEINSH